MCFVKFVKISHSNLWIFFRILNLNLRVPFLKILTVSEPLLLFLTFNIRIMTIILRDNLLRELRIFTFNVKIMALSWKFVLQY